jgi:hypothetical protein
VRRAVDVARWLASAGCPAVCVIDVEPSLIADSYMVKCCRAAGPHRLTALEELRPPPLDPFANGAKRIDGNTWLGPDDHA